MGSIKMSMSKQTDKQYKLFKICTQSCGNNLTENWNVKFYFEVAFQKTLFYPDVIVVDNF